MESATTAAAAAKARETDLTKRLEENAQSAAQAAQAARLREGTLAGELSDAQHKIVELGGRADRAEVSLLLRYLFLHFGFLIVDLLAAPLSSCGTAAFLGDFRPTSCSLQSLLCFDVVDTQERVVALTDQQKELEAAIASLASERARLEAELASLTSSSDTRFATDAFFHQHCLRVQLVIRRIMPIGAQCSRPQVIPLHHFRSIGTTTLS